MPLRPAPKRKVDYGKLDDLQKEIFGSDNEERATAPAAEIIDKTATSAAKMPAARPQPKAPRFRIKENVGGEKGSAAAKQKGAAAAPDAENEANGNSHSSAFDAPRETSARIATDAPSGAHLSDMETIAARIAATKAGQGRSTTRPFSLPRTLIIDTTRLKAKFRTIDEQYTQNVIVDFLVREALGVATPENYKDLRAAAFEFVKRPDEATRRSLTVTEEVVYQMSELKAGINLETGKKYSNDEIFSTLLAVGVGWLYRNGVLS